MDHVISSWVEHVVERLQQRAVLVQQEGLTQELLRLGIVATHHKEVALWGDDVADVIWDVELVCDHDGLSHEVKDLV